MQILLANAKIMNDCSEAQPLTTPMFQTVANELAAEMALCDIDTLAKNLACGRRTIGTLRTTYLVNEEGIIERIFTPKEIKTKIHAEQILNAIK